MQVSTPHQGLCLDYPPMGGGKTGALTTRPEAVFGHRVTNCTCIMEIYEK